MKLVVDFAPLLADPPIRALGIDVKALVAGLTVAFEATLDVFELVVVEDLGVVVAPETAFVADELGVVVVPERAFDKVEAAVVLELV